MTPQTLNRQPSRSKLVAVFTALTLAAGLAAAHGDVTPQAVDTKDLPPLGEKWVAENPYRANDKAIKTGSSGCGPSCRS